MGLGQLIISPPVSVGHSGDDATDEKGQAGLGLLHRQLVGTGLTVSAPAFTSVNFRVSDGRIDAMDLALNIQEGDRILVTPTPVDSGTANLTDIPVSGTVRAKSGKPISSAHVQVRFTKADGLCACKWPKQTLTSDRHGEFGLRLPRLGQFEFCASAPNLHVRCLTIDAKRGDPEQKITLTLLR